MSLKCREVCLNLFAGSAAILSFIGFVELSKYYHGDFGMTSTDLLIWIYLLASWGVFAVFVKGHSAVWQLTSRICMWLSLLVAINYRYGALAQEQWGLATLVLVNVFLLGIGVGFCCKASVSLWAGVRRLVAWLPCLIVVTPFLSGVLMAAPLVWIDKADSRQGSKTATIALLFDEMNARSSAGLKKVLDKHGLASELKVVIPVHGSTAEVIPSMFIQEDFKAGRSCGFTRTCADNAALDFSLVSVRRNDVDVVGFYHPYCAMKGLRSCSRITTSRSMLDLNRAKCAIHRRYGLMDVPDERFCQVVSHARWSELVAGVTEATLKAPALSLGGVLFAHLPFPHPPASGVGTLAQQYAINIERAESLLDQLLSKMESNGVEPQILIFSDHPLRQAIWCGRESVQFDAPCQMSAELEDAHVPVIVAAKGYMPELKNIHSNQQVFDILREWLSH